MYLASREVIRLAGFSCPDGIEVQLNVACISEIEPAWKSSGQAQGAENGFKTGDQPNDRHLTRCRYR